MPVSQTRPLWAEWSPAEDWGPDGEGRPWSHNGAGPLCLHPSHPMRLRYAAVRDLGTWPIPRARP